MAKTVLIIWSGLSNVVSHVSRGVTYGVMCVLWCDLCHVSCHVVLSRVGVGMNRSAREGKSVKRFERSNGPDIALYKNYLYLFLHLIIA